MKFYRLIRAPFYDVKLSHWRDTDEMHRAIHDLPDYFKAVFLELIEKPMSREDIRDYILRYKSAGRQNISHSSRTRNYGTYAGCYTMVYWQLLFSQDSFNCNHYSTYNP